MAMGKGDMNDKLLPIVICDDDRNIDGVNKNFVVIEMEYKFMGYYKRFHDSKEYNEYDSSKRELRKAYWEISKEEESGCVNSVTLKQRKMKWLDDACVWNNRWGEMYTPEDIRQVIDEWLRDTQKGEWLWWRPFKEMVTNANILGKVDHFKKEWEIP